MNRKMHHFLWLTAICVLLQCLNSSFAHSPEKKGFLIKGHVTGLKSDSVYLYNTLTNDLKSAVVHHGNFEFSGRLEFPEMYQVYFDKQLNTWIDLFLENAVITVSGEISSLQNILVRGSASNTEYLAWRKNTQGLSCLLYTSDAADE